MQNTTVQLQTVCPTSFCIHPCLPVSNFHSPSITFIFTPWWLPYLPQNAFIHISYQLKFSSLFDCAAEVSLKPRRPFNTPTSFNNPSFQCLENFAWNAPLNFLVHFACSEPFSICFTLCELFEDRAGRITDLFLAIYCFTCGWGSKGFQAAQTVKNLPAMQETWVQSLGWDDPLEKGMATHSSILAWRIPWTEEPGRLQSMGSKSLDMTECLTLSLDI